MNLTRKLALVLGLAVLGATVAQPAFAHGGRGYGGRVVVGIGVGAPYWGWGGYGWGYPYPYYYPYSYPYPAYVPSQPTTYIQQDAPPAGPAAPAAPQGYWYYCSDAQAYYPYVKECPGGWQRVSPQPAR